MQPLKEAIQIVGGQTHLARAIGVLQQMVWNWLHRSKGVVPAEYAPRIERATDGRVTADRLRPDVHWHRALDPSWPHPDGRPCIDVAAPAVEEAARAAA